MSSVQALPPCCHISCQESSYDRLFYILEKVSAVALGIFSAYVCYELFLAFFALGTAVGVYQYFYSDASDRIAKHKASSCSQNLLEQLTGVKLPALASLIANLGITWCHIDCHSKVFVPIIGFSLGAAAGQTVFQYSKT
jgi:hypothetical protein